MRNKLFYEPFQTLSMIEEAAGTKLYESKKQSALKTIEKKQSKLAEIEKVKINFYRSNNCVTQVLES